MEYAKERKAIVDAYRWLEANEMVIGTWGNVSARLDEGKLMVTPSRVAFTDIYPEDLVVVNAEGCKVEGVWYPSSEVHIHRLIYARRGDVNAIIQCYPTYASAMCASQQGIPPIFEEMSQLIGGGIPVTPEYINAGQHQKLAEAVIETIGQKNAILIRNHAPMCFGRDMTEALTCCKVTEKAAKSYLALKGGVDVAVIPDEMVEAERERYLNRYGHEGCEV